jgi:hypothetical protein
MKTNYTFTLIILLISQGIFASNLASIENKETVITDREALRIKPYAGNPTYWQYNGKPVMLLGGSNQDNLFNHPNIGPDGWEAHLDLLASVGGNYIRNTMSSRDRIDSTSELYNDNNRYPFYFDQGKGLYDLSRWDQAFWDQFERFIQATYERDIIVQIELWDRWDYGEIWGGAYVAEGWVAHPYNPKNNINYTSAETNLFKDKWEGYPIFRTIPELDNAPLVLQYQEAFVEKVLEVTFPYPHVLYCISNESASTEEWSRYWARFIREKARQTGVNIELTEMWNAHDLTDPTHRRTFDYPEIFTFVDTSQNNLRDGETHWINMQIARRLISDPPRPMNNNKVYGGSALGGGEVEGTNKFWRNIIGGVASSRFHRPGPHGSFFGIGLTPLAQTQIRSARILLENFDVLTAQPDVEHQRLKNRNENEAYLAFTHNQQYAVYFPDGGMVDLDMNRTKGRFYIQWLDISKSSMSEKRKINSVRSIKLSAPGDGQWVAIISR